MLTVQPHGPDMQADASSRAESPKAGADKAAQFSKQLSAVLDRVAARGDKLTPEETQILGELAATLASVKDRPTVINAVRDYLDGLRAQKAATPAEGVILGRAPPQR